MPEPLLLSAQAVVPMDPALPAVLFDAGVVITGDVITAVGERADLRRQFGELPGSQEQLDGILLPGLVNAHTHLELSYQSAAKLGRASFPRWVAALIAGYPVPEQIEAVTRAAVREGIAASLRAGVTALGDISRNCAITRSELLNMFRASPGRIPRTISFGEIAALGRMRDRLEPMLEDAQAFPCEHAEEREFISAGLSPHAPYTVEGPALHRIVSRAIIKQLPVCMHLAELAEEARFLRDLSGPLGREWDLMLKMEILDERIPLFDGGPIRWAQRWGLLLADARDPHPRDFPVLLAHVNYCDRAELAQLAASRASVVYCPRTHAYFGHPPHRYRDMLESGINVCLGTDSLASNPDLSVLKEAQRLLEHDAADPPMLLEMITRRGAAALGLDRIGMLAPGKLADLVLLRLEEPGEDPASLQRQIIAQAPEPAAIWLGGFRVL